MTLDELNRLTAGLSGDTEIHILSPWGEIQPAALLTADDLIEGDALLEDLEACQGIVLTPEAQ
jgi:hypothetical protein